MIAPSALKEYSLVSRPAHHWFPNRVCEMIEYWILNLISIRAFSTHSKYGMMSTRPGP
jgi:hypothetical protein